MNIITQIGNFFASFAPELEAIVELLLSPAVQAFIAIITLLGPVIDIDIF